MRNKYIPSKKISLNLIKISNICNFLDFPFIFQERSLCGLYQMAETSLTLCSSSSFLSPLSLSKQTTLPSSSSSKLYLPTLHSSSSGFLRFSTRASSSDSGGPHFGFYPWDHSSGSDPGIYIFICLFVFLLFFMFCNEIYMWLCLVCFMGLCVWFSCTMS